jgi:DNA-binding CsgD family transcriptional regulator
MRAGDLRAAQDRLHKAIDVAGATTSTEQLLEYGRVLVARGAAVPAISVINKALSFAELDANTQASLLSELARAHLGAEGPHASTSIVAQAVAAAESAGHMGAAAATQLDALMISWPTRLISATQGLVASVRESATATHDLRLERRAAAVAAYLDVLSGDQRAVDAAVGAGLEILADPVAELDDLARAAGILSIAGQVLAISDRLEEADRFYQTARALTLRAGADDSYTVLSAGHAEVLVRLGRIAEAAECCEPALPVSQAHVLSAQLGQVLLYLDQPAVSDALLASAEKEARRRDDHLTRLRIWHTRGARLLHEEKYERAAETYARLERTALTELGLGDPGLIPWSICGAMAYLGAGRGAELRRLSEWLDGAAERVPSRWSRIASAVTRACVADSDGDHRRADVLMTLALSIDITDRLTLARIETLLAHGTLLRRAGQWRRARQQLHVAMQLSEAAGAPWLVRHAHQALTRVGGRRRVANTGLTDQESRAARLAARGYSNLEIATELSVSTRTVESHLARVYAKLGINSRRQLMLARFSDNDGHAAAQS